MLFQELFFYFTMQETLINRVFLFPCLKKLMATPGQSNLGTQGEKNDDSRNFCIEKCRKIIKLNSAWCVSKCQVKASCAAIVITSSSPECPLKGWSSPHLRCLYDCDSCTPGTAAIVSPARAEVPAASCAPAPWLVQWQSSWCRAGGGERAWGGGIQTSPPLAELSVNWPWSQSWRCGGGSLHTHFSL